MNDRDYRLTDSPADSGVLEKTKSGKQLFSALLFR